MTITETNYASSLDEAKAVAIGMAKVQGFALRTRTSKLDPTGAVRYLILCCAKGGQFRQSPKVQGTHETKRRYETTTQKTGCKVTVIICFKRALQEWLTRMPNGTEHNHALLPAQDLTKYRMEAVSARLDDIVVLYNAGTAPADIAAQMRATAGSDDDLVGITGQDIRNALARHKRDEEVAAAIARAQIYYGIRQ
ncbi:FAR1 DNA-binding domain-containing protein [Purpureocillium lilacinum]|uniref:FAR1 DNA-binding domain-containing protein n=1 Tax=Purpureocillium lilacinum TaxID=33203 RepID=A0A179H5T3_PURLI|nr:FAR1 DNA-binding domain-containing protein [Purpureocillium lilacinum]